MANNKATPILMELPLEVRHAIFGYVAARDVQPKRLLRYWFEKKEVKEIIAQAAIDDPDGPVPQILYNNDDYDDDSEVDVEESDEDEDAEEDEEDEDAEEQDSDGEEDEQEESDLDEEEVEAEIDTENQDTEIVAEEENDGDQEIAHGDSGSDADETSTPPAPLVSAHGKWRHIPKFMRLTHCPPPVELLLTSKQLNIEAKHWFYNVAVLRIEATGSFAHTSFFEEAFSQINDAAYSPMENIRKVEVTFVWDSTWIRADTNDSVQAIFPALLTERARFVHRILTQAPDLKEVVIHWHDSAQDNESANLMLDVLAPFESLPAKVEIVEHYIAADAKPNRRSVAGKRRVEFENILDMGLDRLF
ncbi:hypothetical protein BDW02DRAFT_502384 [Decorospora gaudefroyi]|uniref:Uncharacterized protein n=1 Tax=Decorospora gaudefroyi TaxID=184978 RepID=A0A6A5K8A9_9PLEO|nr:hypothetical protein BDW02DRAFT_502384 [Decorospora gaudefroyi]